MILRDLVRRLGAGRRVLDTTGTDLAWSADLTVVRADTADDAGPDDVVVLVADPQTTPETAGLPSALPVGTTVLLLVPTALAGLPVPWLVQALAAMRLQATEVVPGATRPFPVAVVARRTDQPIGLTPHLRPDDEPAVPTPAELVGLLGLVVLESAMWRAAEADGLRRRAEDAAALSEVRAERDALHAEVVGLRARLDRVQVLETELRSTRTALDKVLSSTSYRLVRRLAPIRGLVDPRRSRGPGTR